MKLDLNLFIVFEAIFREGNVSRAAKALSLSQPAISHSLAKLRANFDDPLFTRQGSKMLPTPLAENIIDNVRSSIYQLQLSVLQAKQFSPNSSQKHFSIAMHTGIDNVVMHKLVLACTTTAPHIQLTSGRINRNEMASNLASGTFDLVIDTNLAVDKDILHTPLRSDKMLVVANDKHSKITESLSLGDYLQAKHVVVSSRASGMSYEDFELSRIGLQRNVSFRCQQYFSAFQIVSQTDLLLTLPQSIATIYQAHFPIKLFELPAELHGLDLQLYWHKKLDKDPANHWLRNQVILALANSQNSL
jgi:DNA-binding transcriptional LysR family regulator